ncbi:MAG: type II secretion system F family protein, partial [Pseudomonadota bacterium]
MTSYRHIAVDAAGQVTKGTLQTSSREDAIRLLSAQGLTPISVQRQILSTNVGIFGKSSTKDILNLFDQLATLLGAGIPLAEGLSVLSERPGRLGAQASDLLGSVRQGSSFAEALKISPQSPSDQTLALVKIGEETGTLGQQLLLISDNMKQARKFEQELIGGLIYPLILGLLLVATVFFLAHFILPQFET